MIRSNYCGLINKNYLDKIVTIQGWINKRRDHGGVVFIDLRDREGVVQIVIEPDTPKAFKTAEIVRNEFVLNIVGKVRLRPEGTKNNNIISGEIEIKVQEMEILNKSITPAFQIDDENISEQIRLIHRVLDLRRPFMQKNLKIRFEITKVVRNYLNNLGFIDIETPILTRSTPEGARDYLVPSRIQQGEFYALPQSPQLFKQLLMIANFDRYYQITKCFRDEDLRSDRQPEFTQIDLETSFLDEKQIMEIVEGLIKNIFKEILHITLESFPILDYKTSLSLYGSDKPDLRIKLKFTDLTDLMQNEEFKVFHDAANLPNGKVVALLIPHGSNFSRKEIDEFTKFVSIYGAKGLAYIKINDINSISDDDINTALQSPIVKFLSINTLKAIIDKTQAQNGDIIFFGADKAKIVNDAMGALRVKIGYQYGKQNGYFTDEWNLLWVVDFPMFEYSDEENRYNSMHHPFTQPKDDHENILVTDPDNCLSKAYDLVLNGSEIGGGSIRIHTLDIQQKVFATLKINEIEQNNKFGFLMNNLKYGTPPHGGFAFGLDRLVAMMLNCESIRDVIAFPKTQRAQCLLTNSPNTVSDKQLKELGLKLQNKKFD